MPDRSAEKPSSRRKNAPSPEEIEALAALFNAGNFAAAADLARSMTERFPLHWAGWKMLGVAFKQMGRSAEALAPMQKTAALSPADAEAHNNLGIVLRDLGRLNEAEASYRRALRIRPEYAQAHGNLGALLQELGRLDEAEASYRMALRILPDYARGHSNLGALLHDLGRLEEAEASYREALEIAPDYAEAHYNRGVTLNDLGRKDEAEASYRRALQIQPGYCAAHCALGGILQELGRSDEAEACYRQALTAQPNSTAALNGLAALLAAQGKPMAALDSVERSLLSEETAEAKSLFASCVKRLHLPQDQRGIRAAMARALSEPWARPTDLAEAGAALVKLEADIGTCVARANAAWPLRLAAQELFGPNGLAVLADDALLCALLDSTPVCDVEMERFLTLARHALLDAATETAEPSEENKLALNFHAALARQCFINEYVFSLGDEEVRKACALRDKLLAALEAGSEIPLLWPVAVAAYFPLASLAHADRLLNGQWPDSVTALLTQQVREPAEEARLRATIPCLTGIDDEVSLLVQEQYEENPYPRWIKAAPAGEARNIVGYLRRKFPLAAFKHHEQAGRTEILIAGCGTGQHPIGAAQRIRGAQVLAVDLSMSSLAYAKRKTLELGLTSIEYAQADLLKLPALGRSFDVVESSGVLHHLADPWAGWRALLSLLRPGGFMKLGFYSELARRNVVRARTFIAERGYASTSADIRRCRQDLMDLGNGADLGSIPRSPDFFSTSTCRDLLFHVHEQRMDLSGIAAFLGANHLDFLGFEVEGEVLRAYRQRFPEDSSATDLAKWEIFEHENPDTFGNMYQFWVQNHA